MFKKSFFVLILAAHALASVAQKKPNTSEVRVNLQHAPAVLNPVTYIDFSGEFIMGHLYQSLISLDPYTLEPVPVLADSFPIILDSLGQTYITFRIRPEAKWDTNRFIVARDVEFSLKAIKAPGIDNSEKREAFQKIIDIELSLNDPRKFTLVVKDYSFEVFDLVYDLFIIDPYIYDPENLLRKFSIKDLDRLEKESQTKTFVDRNLTKFAIHFNQINYIGQNLIGSGPYLMRNLGEGENYVLEKKKIWWGSQLSKLNPYFEANPDVIIFSVESNESEALKSLMGNKVDLIYGISTQAFNTIKADRQASRDFHFSESPKLSYEYIGLNTKKPVLSDVAARRALAYMLDYNYLINSVYEGAAQRSFGIVPAALKLFYNKPPIPYGFNMAIAQQLLREAGWKDTDNDGLLDKVIAGGKRALRLDFAYNTEYPYRKLIGDHLKENAAKIGIEIDVQGYDQSFLSEKLTSKEFDMYAGGWYTGPTLMDPKTIWCTEAQANGYNYCGFGNPTTDALVNQVSAAHSPFVQVVPMRELQQTIYSEAPFIFLATPVERIVINSRFLKPQEVALKPGFWPMGMKQK